MELLEDRKKKIRTEIGQKLDAFVDLFTQELAEKLSECE